MEDENEITQAGTPDVEIQRVTGNGDGEQESESAGTEFQILSAKVDNLTTLMTQFFPSLLFMKSGPPPFFKIKPPANRCTFSASCLRAVHTGRAT